MDTAAIIEAAAKAVFVFAMLLVLVLFTIWAERKILADMQSRIGPNRAGPFGLLQTLADGIKLFFKEDIMPTAADKIVYPLAPIVSMIPALVAFSVVPFGDTITIAGREITLQLADLNVAVLFFLSMGSVSVYGIALAGWSSGSKYPLLGSVRATAQLLSYEAAFGLAVLGVLVQSGTLSTREIVNSQAWIDWQSFVSEWYLLPALIPFAIFLIAATAETNHPPFDLVEAEQELVGGFHTEYTGIRFAIFFLAEFMNVITMSAVAVTLFLGGPSGPNLGFLAVDNVVNVWLMPVVWFVAKVLVLVFATFWVRASLPRMRYDRLMALGWKYLIEIAILWVLVSVAIVVAREEGWNVAVTTIVAAVVALLAYGMLWLAMPKAGEQVEEFR